MRATAAAASPVPLLQRRGVGAGLGQPAGRRFARLAQPGGVPDGGAQLGLLLPLGLLVRPGLAAQPGGMGGCPAPLVLQPLQLQTRHRQALGGAVELRG